MSENTKKPILLLHGAWCGAWVWSKVIPLLSAAGHPVVALDLPGHGLDATIPAGYAEQNLEVLASAESSCSTIDSVQMAEYAAEQIKLLYGTYGEVSVVGHSLAGTCLSVLGERVPELIGDLVYFAALAPLPGGAVIDRIAVESFSKSLFPLLPIADPAALGAMRLNFTSRDEQYQRNLFDCLYDPSVKPNDMVGVTHLLTPDTPWRMYADSVSLTSQKWGSVSRSWIRATADLAVPIDYQDETIALLDEAFPDSAFSTVTLETGHMAMLSEPAASASAILKAIGSTVSS